jgi:hypothetical protein
LGIEVGCKDAKARANGKCGGASLLVSITKGFGVLDVCCSPIHCLDPCGLVTCIADLVRVGINNVNVCTIIVAPGSVSFAFRESTPGLSATLDSPIDVCPGCQGDFLGVEGGWLPSTCVGTCCVVAAIAMSSVVNGIMSPLSVLNFSFPVLAGLVSL